MSDKKTKGTVTLGYIVHIYLMDIEDNTTRHKKKALQYAVLALEELNLYVADYPQAKDLPINPNNTVDLPEDYIGFVNIGAVVNGRIVTLSRNDDIVLPRETDECGDIEGNDRNCKTDDIAAVNFTFGGGYYYAFQYRNGQYVGEQYGAGGGEGMTSYRIDRTRRQIVFDRRLPSSFETIRLEYTSSGIDPLGCTIVERQYVQVIRAYVHWQMGEYGKGTSAFEKQRRESQYYIQYEKAVQFESLFTKDEYLDQQRRDEGSIVRR